VNFENFKGLKDCPTHQVRHIGKAHKAGTQQPTLQKCLPCSYAQATLCGATEAHIIDDYGERANVQQGVCQNTGRRNLSSAFVILFGSGSGLDVFQMPPHRQAVNVSGQAMTPHPHLDKINISERQL
jgi:hypothetical protein